MFGLINNRNFDCVQDHQYAVYQESTSERIADVVYVIFSRNGGVANFDIFNSLAAAAQFAETHLINFERVLLPLIIPSILLEPSVRLS